MDNSPASTPDESDDLRAALEAAWDETSGETVSQAPVEREAPAPETESAAAERKRDELGRFAKAEQEAAEAADKAAKAVEAKATEQAVQTPQEGQQTPVEGRKAPPTSWSVAAKAEFDKLPVAVQEAVAKREAEVNQGFAKLAEYKGLDPYVEMARQYGTTLPEALDRYRAAEQLLERDFVSGIASLCQMYNVHPAQLAQAFLGQQQGHQQPQQPDPFQPVFQKVQTLEQRLEQYERQKELEQTEAINRQLSEFASDPAHRYFENVKQDMGRLLQAGQASDLKDAYDKACWLHPEIRELRIKEAQAPFQQAQAVNKARAASKSIPTGAPIPGAIATGGGSNSVRGAIEDAWASMSSQV